MPKNRIHKRKDGRYLYRVTDTQGQRLELMSYQGETLRAFSRRCDVLDFESSKVQEDHGTLDMLFDRWAKDYQALQCSKADVKVTRGTYERLVSPTLGKLPIHEIKRADVYKLLAQMDKKGYSTSYMSKARLAISRPFNWAIDILQLDLINPTQGLIYRKKKQASTAWAHRALTDEEMERISQAAKASKYANYFEVLRLTGLRPSEALGLQINDIQEEHLEIRRGVTIYEHSQLKSSAAVRDLPLTPPLRAVLLDQKSKVTNRNPWLFPTSNGTPSMNAIRLAFDRIIAATAVYERGGRNGRKKLRLIRPPIKASMYDYRHTFATRMAEAGMQAKALQTILGHSSITVTLEFYVGLSDEAIKQAAKIMEASYDSSP